MTPLLMAPMFLAMSCGEAPPTETDDRLVIVYTNNVDGEIEPCG